MTASDQGCLALVAGEVGPYGVVAGSFAGDLPAGLRQEFGELFSRCRLLGRGRILRARAFGLKGSARVPFEDRVPFAE